MLAVGSSVPSSRQNACNIFLVRYSCLTLTLTPLISSSIIKFNLQSPSQFLQSHKPPPPHHHPHHLHLYHHPFCSAQFSSPTSSAGRRCSWPLPDASISAHQQVIQQTQNTLFDFIYFIHSIYVIAEKIVEKKKKKEKA